MLLLSKIETESLKYIATNFGHSLDPQVNRNSTVIFSKFDFLFAIWKQLFIFTLILSLKRGNFFKQTVQTIFKMSKKPPIPKLNKILYFKIALSGFW